MKKHIKLFLSLILAFTLIPILHINTASATYTVKLGEVTVPPTTNYNDPFKVATCIINDASSTFTATPTETPTDGNKISGCAVSIVNGSSSYKCESYSSKIEVSKQTEVILGIINGFGDTKTFDTTLQLDAGANGCGVCTTLNGVHINLGDISSCGSGSEDNNNDNTNKDTSGVSRILTSLATILGGLLLLF